MIYTYLTFFFYKNLILKLTETRLKGKASRKMLFLKWQWFASIIYCDFSFMPHLTVSDLLSHIYMMYISRLHIRNYNGKDTHVTAYRFHSKSRRWADACEMNPQSKYIISNESCDNILCLKIQTRKFKILW